MRANIGSCFDSDEQFQAVDRLGDRVDAGNVHHAVFYARIGVDRGRSNQHPGRSFILDSGAVEI
jgi:hypothetical protein